MLDAAWRNLVVTGRAFQFQEIDAQSIPFEEATFGAVIANHMLYHVPDRPRGFQEIKRVLRPGGRLLATTVGENHMKEMMDWYARVHVSRVWESFANPFTLENGLEQLKPYFPTVSLSHYEDNLEITEVEPVMAYIRSGFRVSELAEEELAKLQHELEIELKAKGRVFISKDSGLFEAMK
jgi:ubiquinone/menaquinone biosynthesis C-methylase UbiE